MFGLWKHILKAARIVRYGFALFTVAILPWLVVGVFEPGDIDIFTVAYIVFQRYILEESRLGSDVFAETYVNIPFNKMRGKLYY